MASVNITGYLTITDSKYLSQSNKEKFILDKKNIKINLIDMNGDSITLTGALFISKKGNLTAKFSTKINQFEIINLN